jgi:hypothetical protein
MDDISPPRFTATDQATNVASYARALALCDDRNCELIAQRSFTVVEFMLMTKARFNHQRPKCAPPSTYRI